MPIQKEVQVWNVRGRDRQAALPFTDYSGFLGADRPELQFSEAGDSLRVNGDSKNLKWSYMTGSQPVAVPSTWWAPPNPLFPESSEAIKSILLSPDARSLGAVIKPQRGASCFRFWRKEKLNDWRRSRVPVPISGFAGAEVTFMALSMDSGSLALVTSAGNVDIFDAETVERRAEVKPGRKIQSVAFSPDDKTLLAAGAGDRESDGELSFWDVKTGRVLERDWAAEPMRCATYSPKGDWVAAVEGQSTVVVRRVPRAGDHPPTRR